ncbi:flagellar biosynthesis anti-sigma factor FlgM [Virgibacillus halophilus]|uniref:Negative regulator of flagellin synthesis n=1 Tax=Tigheibacillus halophilus TaxID=361280 RepID=A0ABU5C259_9BACI|nr:flagellar biosynthesis anti-sigma factor FlgM [Virgibacillus halophilus]
MKINGPNQSHINLYQKQMQKQTASNQINHRQQDKLQISDKAKIMQESSAADASRKARVEKIKQDITSGEYQINYEETAEKMLDFWKGK